MGKVSQLEIGMNFSFDAQHYKLNLLLTQLVCLLLFFYIKGKAHIFERANSDQSTIVGDRN